MKTMFFITTSLLVYFCWCLYWGGSGLGMAWFFVPTVVLFGVNVLAVDLLAHGGIEPTLCSWFSYRDIHIEGDLYLRRWFLTPRHWRWRLFLHHIMRPDKARELHDHPFDFYTLGVWRWYREELMSQGDRMRRLAQGQDSWRLAGIPSAKRVLERMSFGKIKFRWATHTHRITEVAPGGSWTLLLVGQARREWGFWLDDGWHSAKSLGIEDGVEDVKQQAQVQ